MEILLLFIVCVVYGVAIILLWVSHFRGNRRGKGVFRSDLKSAFELQKKLDGINAAGRDLSNTFHHLYHD